MTVVGVVEAVSIGGDDRGLPTGLAGFYREQHPRVLGSLRLYLGDDQVAAELAQDVFEVVCRRWSHVQAMEHPGPWVHRVAMNRATSWFRRRGAERRASGRAGRARRGPSPEEALALRALVAALPPKERAVIVLRYYADLSITETAATLGIPEGTVKTRARRGIEVLRTTGLAIEEERDD